MTLIRRAGIAHAATIFTIGMVAVAGLALITVGPQLLNTTAQSSSTTLASTVFPNGLELQINMNATTVPENGSIFAQVSLTNTLDSNLSLIPSSNTKNLSAWDWNDRICGLSDVYDLFAYAVFQGHITAANLSSTEAPLSLIPLDAGFSCPYFPTQVRGITFAPQSDIATISEYYSFGNMSTMASTAMSTIIVDSSCSSTSQVVTVTTTVNGTTSSSTTEEPGSTCGPGSSLNGYYALPSATETATCCEFHPLTSGEYTVVAMDMWNQTLFAYFQVVPLH